MEELLLSKLHDDAKKIYSYELESETETTVTYRVTYKEVVCGISGKDTESVTLNKNSQNPN